MGTPSFAVPTLDLIYKSKHQVSAVVTVPDKKKGRGLKTDFSEVKKFALEKNIKLLQPDSLKDFSFIKEIESLSPDLIVVVAFRILPKEVFTLPQFGAINLHASLLPKYRGAAPINHALINGEKNTGVTTFFLKEKVDTGNIILQKSIEISDEDNAGSLHDKLSLLGADTVIKTIDLIENGNYELKIQDESQATPAPKIFKKDCIINWNLPSEILINLIRGLSPYPCAFTHFKDKSIKIYTAKASDLDLKLPQGKFIAKNKKLFTGTSDGNIEIIELQLEGKKRINALDFVNRINTDEELYFN